MDETLIIAQQAVARALKAIGKVQESQFTPDQAKFIEILIEAIGAQSAALNAMLAQANAERLSRAEWLQ